MSMSGPLFKLTSGNGCSIVQVKKDLPGSLQIVVVLFELSVLLLLCLVIVLVPGYQ